MKVIVAGDIKQPLLLNTKKATAVLIETDDGRPTVIFKLSAKGWVRLTKGEDPNFDDEARRLELLK